MESESSVEDEVFEAEVGTGAPTASNKGRESSPVFYLDPEDWARTQAPPSPVPSPLAKNLRWALSQQA